MKTSKTFSFNEYLVIILIILLILGNIYQLNRTAQKAQKEEIKAAYSEGYANGYYDCENGNPYDEDR